MKKVLISGLTALVLLAAFLGLMSQNAQIVRAESQELTTDVYLYNDDGQVYAGDVLTTSLAFTTQSNVFNFTNAPITATVVFLGFGPEWNPTFDHGQSVTGDFAYDPDTGTATWNGVIPAQTVGEFWSHASDNVSFQTNSWFTVELDLGGALQAHRMGVYNPNPIPQPTPVNFSTYVWATDGNNTANAGGTLETEGSYTTGFALYHDSLEPVTATITMSPYPAERLPVPGVGNGLTGVLTNTGSADTYTWTGILNPANTASEFWVSVENNDHYSQTVMYELSWEAAGQTGTEIVSVYNPAEPPPPEPTMQLLYLPMMFQNTSTEEELVRLDVSASDGQNSSQNGQLTTSNPFAVNAAVFSNVTELLTATVTFSGFDPSWNTSPGQEPGLMPDWTENDDGDWIWQGQLEQGIDTVTEFWVNVPGGKTGEHQFTVTVSIDGQTREYSGNVTVTVP